MMKIGILYNYWIDKNSPRDKRMSDNEIVGTVTSVRKVLKKEHKVIAIRYRESLINRLKEEGFEFIFNLCEGIKENSLGEAIVAQKLESIDIPYTGSGPLTLEKCINKRITKDIFIRHKLPTPNYRLYLFYKKGLYKKDNDFNTDLKYPLIVKPVHEDGSVGITHKSVVHNKDELSEMVRSILKEYKQDVLVEEYIEGRELNVAVVGNNGSLEVLPISEIIFEQWDDNIPRIVGFEEKWFKNSTFYKKTIRKCPADLSKDVEEKIKTLALETYKVVKCRDYGRIDFRLKDDIPYILEINPNPSISTDSGFAVSAGAAGYSYENIIKRILDEAVKRYHVKSDQ